jgi:IS30 family transposase
MEENPDTPLVEMDTVEGEKGGKVLLTLHFVQAEMMLAFLRDHNDSRSVIDIFDLLYETIGHDLFCKVFRVCLTDNGSEFSNPVALENSSDGRQRTRIFYCDPGRPDQKGSAERNHEFIRRFFPKGSSFDHCTQEDIRIMMDHINSYHRESIGGRSPYEMFSFMYGEEILKLLKCHTVPASEVTLKKSVFRKEVH